jgi:CRP-like cAMP-binding protein
MGLENLKIMMQSIVEMDDEVWEASKHYFKLKHLNKKQYFLKQGEVCKYLGFVDKGYTRLFYDLKNAEVTKDFNTEYQFCGSYASFIAETPSHFNVIAMEPLEVWIINKQQLLELTEQFSCWQKFLRIVMERLFISKEDREALFLTTTPEERYELMVSENPDWLKRIPLKYLASYLGLTPETISRVRSRLK